MNDKIGKGGVYLKTVCKLREEPSLYIPRKRNVHTEKIFPIGRLTGRVFPIHTEKLFPVKTREGFDKPSSVHTEKIFPCF
jgi:hypothetical protein